MIPKLYQYPGTQNNQAMKVLPLLCKQLEVWVAWMTMTNGSPNLSSRNKKTVLNHWFGVNLLKIKETTLYFIISIISLKKHVVNRPPEVIHYIQ